jgi:hypothetical protein
MGVFLSILDGLLFIVARNVGEHLRQVNLLAVPCDEAGAA